MNIVLLMMGGSGTRFGARIPKQYILVKDRPIFSYIMYGYQDCSDIDAIVAVSHSDWIEYVREWAGKMGISKLSAICPGGENRSESVRNGLLAMQRFASGEDVILIHDATHPYVDREGTRKIIDAVRKYGGATLGQRQYDTVYQMNPDTMMLEKVVKRETIVSGASPEAFFYKDLFRIYTEATGEQLEAMTSAGAIAIDNNIPMQVIPTRLTNLKITYQPDLELFRQLVDLYFPQLC